MSLALTQSATAIGPNLTASFLATGGTAPYVYSVVPGGAGGSIDAGTGRYQAPAAAQSDPKLAFDTILVTDAVAATATCQILVGNALLLFCEVLQRELGLANGRVYLWDQKLMQPADAGLYVAVSVLSCKPFSNRIGFDATGVQAKVTIQGYSLKDFDTTPPTVVVHPGLTFVARQYGVGGNNITVLVTMDGYAGSVVASVVGNAVTVVAANTTTGQEIKDAVAANPDTDSLVSVHSTDLSAPMFAGLANLNDCYTSTDNTELPGYDVCDTLFSQTPAPLAGGSGFAPQSVQMLNVLATLDIDVISRGPEARDRKEEVVMALNSYYAEAQQEANSFYIAKLPPGSRFINLSSPDGAAIPYRFKISVNLQYSVLKTKAVPYFDTFLGVDVSTDP